MIREKLGKSIPNLIFGMKVLNTNFLGGNIFSNEVTINIYMFHPGIKDWIIC